MTVVIVDHGLCNTGSARRAFEECGAKVVVTNDPAELAEATHAVLPGVGAFNLGMTRLRESGWDIALRKAVAERSLPLLGICLGMQLLADRGFEGGETSGLGLISGEVVRMTPSAGERLPHVGWNDIRIERPSPLLEGIPEGTDFYFVHSYQLATKLPESRVATTAYCGGLTAIVSQGSVFGVQFHPEKSSKAGFQLIRNFLKT